jgi:hypothetical protein
MKVYMAMGMLLGMPILAHAQTPQMPQMPSPEMMQKLQAAQACMARIGEGPMQKLQAESQAMEQEVKVLCAAGKRDEAMQQVTAFGLKVAQSPEVKAMQECTKGMENFMPSPMVGTPFAPQLEHKEKERHICDL